MVCGTDFILYVREKRCGNSSAASRALQLSDGARVERGERVSEAPMLRPGLLTATGDVQHKLEHLHPHFFHCRIAGGNTAGVDIDQIRSEEHTSELQSL